MDMRSASISAAFRGWLMIIENGAAAGGAFFMAMYSKVEFISVLGSVICATALMSVLGLLLSEAVPAMRIRNITGRKRLLANWCCGLAAYWFAYPVRNKYFPDCDIELVASGCAAVLALMGVSVVSIAIRISLKKAASIEESLDDKPPRE